MDIRVQIDYPREMPWLLPLIQAEFKATMERAGDGMIAAIARQYVLVDAVASEQTAKAFHRDEVQFSGDRMELTIAPRGDRAKIAEWIELGRPENKSGHPSIQMAANIREWASAKGILPADERSANALAWGIATVIAQEGFEGRHPVERATRAYTPHVRRMFEAATRRLAKKIEARVNATVSTP
jgi:hypothetical protein